MEKIVRSTSIFSALIKYLKKRSLMGVKLLIILFAFLLLLYGLLKSYSYSYDESNTLAISFSAYKDINIILSNEQNFPLYYYLVKTFSFLGNRVFLLNYSIWFLSVFSFYLFLRKFFNNGSTVWAGVFLFVLSPAISYYSSYIRMYSLIILFGIWYLYALLNYYSISSYNKKYFFVMLILGALMSALHPSTIIFWCFVFVFILLNKYSYKSILLLLTLVFNLGLISYLVFLKNDPIPVYFRSLDYVGNSGFLHYINFSQLYLLFYDKFGILITFSFLFCIYYFTKNRLFKISLLARISYISLIFIFISFIVLDKYFIARYFGLFNLFYIFSILIVLENVQASFVKKTIVAFFVAIIFLLNIKFYAFNINSMKMQKKYCDSLKNFNSDSLIITSFRNINTVFSCSNVTELAVFNWDGITVLYKDMTIENLTFQAKTGGFYTLQPVRPGFLNYIKKDKLWLLPLHKITDNYKYLVYSLEYGTVENTPIYSEELNFMLDFGDYDTFIPPSSYVFVKK